MQNFITLNSSVFSNIRKSVCHKICYIRSNTLKTGKSETRKIPLEVSMMMTAALASISRVWNKVEIAPTNTKRDISSHSTMTQGLPQCNLFLRAHPKQLENDVSVDFTQNE